MGRPLVEIASILFLFYANLLMGEFTAHTPPGRTLLQGVCDIFTWRNFLIAVVAATVAELVFGYLRWRVEEDK